jgi:hypothetical protein
MPTPREAPRPPPASSLLHTVLPDTALDRSITALELFEERDAYSLLVTALASLVLEDALGDEPPALDGPEVALIRGRVAAKLRAVAELQGADAVVIARAEQDLESGITMLIDAAAE